MQKILGHTVEGLQTGRGGKARLWEDLINEKTLGSKTLGSLQLCPVMEPEAMDPTLQHSRVCSNIRKHFFIGNVPEHWHRFPRHVVESASLERV